MRGPMPPTPDDQCSPSPAGNYADALDRKKAAVAERQAALAALGSGSLQLIQAHELRAILGNVSDMWLWRRLREGDFPKPFMIGKRRFWRRDEIAAYIERQSDQRTAASTRQAA